MKSLIISLLGLAGVILVAFFGDVSAGRLWQFDLMVGKAKLMELILYVILCTVIITLTILGVRNDESS